MIDTGTYRCYVPKRFSEENNVLIGKANEVIEEYEARGFMLTVRQIYYQFVARGWLPNNLKSYGKIQSLISDGRLAGLISWTAIEDRGRTLRGTQTFNGPGELLKNAAETYRADLWQGQKFRPEVWVEKAALEGVVEDICMRLRVNFYATRGYDSQSQSWRAGQRFADYTLRGQIPVVLHLGDHDPSGIDMTRDNTERLELFTGYKVIVIRLALNFNQIEQYNPPPNPAKMSDSRAENYVRQYGDESWELDALDPTVMQDLIEAEVAKMRNDAQWLAALAEEVQERRALQDIANSFGA